MRSLIPRIATLLLLVPSIVHAQESIPSMNVTAIMQEGRQLTISEEIRYDFGQMIRHGIERFLPTRSARDGATYYLRPSVESITRDGRPEPYERTKFTPELRLRIGDPSTTISGTHTYVITYHTDRAYLFFPDHDELYWNVTGDEWPVTMEAATFRLQLSAGIDTTAVKAICYTGTRGSTASDCATHMEHGEVVVTASRVLLGHEGMTVAVWLPPGSVPAPTFLEKFFMFFADNGILFFPLAAFCIMFFLWWTRGRDAAVGTIVPEYTPPNNLSAGVLASVMKDEAVPSTAITATILDLARRGFLTIRFQDAKKLFGTKTEITFVRTRASTSGCTDAEHALFEGMFESGNEQTPSDLAKNKFYQSITTFKKYIRDETEALGIYEASPRATRPAYILVGMFTAIGLSWVFNGSLLEMVASFATGLIIGFFGYFMPKRNAKGTDLLRRIDGFQWFLSVTEKDRMAFHQAPSRTPEQFYALLPYAVVFGIEKEWASQFASMLIPPPSWAEGSITTWNAVRFASVVHDFHHEATRGMYAATSSAGRGQSGFSGGGSGGGFGGGGGGSW